LKRRQPNLADDADDVTSVSARRRRRRRRRRDVRLGAGRFVSFNDADDVTFVDIIKIIKET
jgi:hypothetical protein